MESYVWSQQECARGNAATYQSLGCSRRHARALVELFRLCHRRRPRFVIGARELEHPMGEGSDGKVRLFFHRGAVDQASSAQEVALSLPYSHHVTIKNPSGQANNESTNPSDRKASRSPAFPPTPT